MTENQTPDTTGKEPKTVVPQSATSGLDALQTVFFVTFMMGCFFLATRPTQVQAALLFRYALIAVGAIGLIVVAVLKKKQA